MSEIGILNYAILQYKGFDANSILWKKKTCRQISSVPAFTYEDVGLPGDSESWEQNAAE